MSSPSNILFLMTDQMQGRVLAADHPCQTPNLDRLMARGVRVSQAYTPNPVCSPARASLMTGLQPHSHGVQTVTHVVPRDQSVLRDVPHWAQALQASGYRTGYFGKWHVDQDDNPGAYGWDTVVGYKSPAYRELQAARNPTETHWHVRREPGTGEGAIPGYPPYLLYGVTDRTPEQRSCGILSDLALDWLETVVADDAPWCCFVSVIEPHDPFVCGKDAYDLYDPATLPVPANWHDDLDGRPGLYRKSARAFGDVTLEDKRQAMACYYAMITEIDSQYGRILDRLEAAGQLEDTLVVFTSDHGEFLGAHGLYQKNVGAWEEAYNIPLIVAGPGVADGVSVDARVGLQDLGETIVELAGAGSFSTAESRSAAPLLRQPEAQAAAYQTGYAESFGGRYLISQRVVWDGPWKFVSNWFDEDEIYNLADDPGELRNLIADPACRPQVERLMARAWRFILATDDHPLGRATYASLRLAPIGMLAGQGSPD